MEAIEAFFLLTGFFVWLSVLGYVVFLCGKGLQESAKKREEKRLEERGYFERIENMKTRQEECRALRAWCESGAGERGLRLLK